jgi:hypothetical protein
MVAKVDEIFSGYQACQLIKNYQRFKDHLFPHLQTSVIFNQLTLHITREDVISYKEGPAPVLRLEFLDSVHSSDIALS